VIILIRRAPILQESTMAEPDTTDVPQGSEELEKQGFEGIVHALMKSTDPKIRQYAAYLLGKTKNPHAIQPLIEALADLEKPVREQATLALSSIGKAAIKPLIETLQEPKWQTRYRAAEALGGIADENVVKPLIRTLKDNRDHVRYMAAKGLLGLEDSRAVESLVILLKDENRYVRLMAVRALAAIGGKTVEEALTEASFREPDEKVREAILEALI
jgi:HEAT repeat protein